MRIAEGRVRWGYHQAALLRTCLVTWNHDEKVWELSATAASADAFRLSQRPLTFVVAHATGVWRWPVQELQIADGAVTARLGPKEKSDVSKPVCSA